MVITVSQPFEIHFFQGWSLEAGGGQKDAKWVTLGGPVEPMGDLGGSL